MFAPLDQPILDIPVVAALGGDKASAGGRVYAIALRTLRDGGAVESWDSLIRYPAFGARDRRRSGLSREALLAVAPRQAVMQELLRRLRGAPFVVALCELDLVPEIADLCGARVVDLVFAAQYFMPWQTSFTPKGLWELVNRPRRRETASMAVEAMAALGCDLAKYLCGNCLNDQVNPQAPALRSQLAASGTLFGALFTQLTEHHRDYFGGLLQPKSVPDEPDWTKFLTRVPQRPKAAPAAGGDAFRPVPKEALAERFAALARAAPDFRVRDAQLRYAAAVVATLNAGDHAVLAVEAGTGTGKTFGYLVPALEFLYRNPRARVAVSTYTKNLQDQILGGEVAALQRIFPIYKDISVAVLKGKSSYVCAERLGNVLDAEGLVGEDLLRWTYLLNLLFSHDKVEIGAVGDRVRRHLDAAGQLTDLRNEVSAKTGCTPEHGVCPAQHVSAAAREARLIVTNHHKLALLDGDPLFSGLFDRCIVDEANLFEQAVRGAVKVEIESRELVKGLEYVAERLPLLRSAAAVSRRERVDAAAAAIVTARREIVEIGSALERQSGAGCGFEERWLEPAHAGFRDGSLFNNLRDLAAELQGLSGKLSPLIKTREAGEHLHPRTVRRFDATIDSLAGAADAMRGYATPSGANNRFFTVRLWKRHWWLAASPIDVAGHLRASFYPVKQSVVFTSATITYRRSLGMFLRTLGLAAAAADDSESDGAAVAGHRCRTLVIPSPFGPAQRLIIQPAGAASGKYDQKEAWLAALRREIPARVKAEKGGTLVLFASYGDLDAVADAVEDEIGAAGFPLLVQKRGVPTASLSEEFRAVRESVLFGAETFWYGVDFKGETLTQVIITRIPFANPGEPLAMGRKRLYPADEFWERTYYDTAIKLKQGIGRLIRGERDRGTVVILDSRYRSFERKAGLGLPPEPEDQVPELETARAAEGPAGYLPTSEDRSPSAAGTADSRKLVR